jgi:peptidyl-prolyl cis-trans isomerase C
MVKAFGNAVVSLEKGSYTKEPVQTQFGWHLILLEDERATTPPAFEQSKNQIRTTLRRKSLEEYIERLRNQAQIDIKMQPAIEPAAAPTKEPEGS